MGFNRGNKEEVSVAISKRKKKVVNHTMGNYIRHNVISAKTPFIINVDVILHEFYTKMPDYLQMYHKKDKLYKAYPKFCMSSP